MPPDPASLWSSTSPTESGWYFVRWKPESIEEIAFLNPKGEWRFAGMERRTAAPRRFGPRIPSAADIHETSDKLNAAICARSEADRRIRELEDRVAECEHALGEYETQHEIVACDGAIKEMFDERNRLRLRVKELELRFGWMERIQPSSEPTPAPSEEDIAAVREIAAQFLKDHPPRSKSQERFERGEPT